MCCRYACLKAAAAKRRARHADGRRCGCDVFCFKIVAVLGMDMHFCDPNQLIATKQRNKGCCQQGSMLPHARIVQRGPAYTGFSDTCVCLSLRLFVRNVERESFCVEMFGERLRSRSSNENRKGRMLRRRLLRHEEDRSRFSSLSIYRVSE